MIAGTPQKDQSMATTGDRTAYRREQVWQASQGTWVRMRIRSAEAAKMVDLEASVCSTRDMPATKTKPKGEHHA